MSHSIEALLPGQEIHTEAGACYVIRQRYPAPYQHGQGLLHHWLEAPLPLAATMQQQRAWQGLQPRDCLFLDIETTGLDGADTLAFMVGVGFFDGDSFELWQYFLREPEEESAMLIALGDLLPGFAGLVTFNGRGFDVPMLQGRYQTNGRPLELKALPNFDLLQVARQLWRHLPSRRLAALEQQVLGVQRSTEDVPGSLIPRLYYDYLNSGDARPMQQVAYHNTLDVLSMVTLGTLTLQRFQTAQGLSAAEALSLGMWYRRMGMLPETDSVLSQVLEQGTAAQQISACACLGDLHRRQGRFQNAERIWQHWAALAPDDPEPAILLAKYYENTCRQMAEALHWAERAHAALEQLPPSSGKGLKLTAIQKRIKRLQKHL